MPKRSLFTAQTLLTTTLLTHHTPTHPPPKGIKAIKLYAWEEPYLERISALRETELKAIRRTQLLGMVRARDCALLLVFLILVDGSLAWHEGVCMQVCMSICMCMCFCSTTAFIPPSDYLHTQTQHS